MSGKPSDQEGLFVVLSIHKSVCKRIYRFSKPIIFDKIREEKTHWNSIVSWITWRDLVQLVKIGVQSRGMGRYILNVVCFFLCPDADCLRNNLSNRCRVFGPCIFYALRKIKAKRPEVILVLASNQRKPYEVLIIQGKPPSPNLEKVEKKHLFSCGIIPWK